MNSRKVRVLPLPARCGAGDAQLGWTAGAAERRQRQHAWGKTHRLAACLAIAAGTWGLFVGSAGAGDDPHARSAVIEQYCFDCHNTTDWAGGTAFDVNRPGESRRLVGLSYAAKACSSVDA
jgi:hypothetical protein